MSMAPRPVVLIDDDASVRRALERLLRSAGYGVRTFTAAQEFLSHAACDGDMGCLVLDVRMPGQDGLALYEALLARGHAVPVVFITGQADVSTAARAIRSGAVDVLTKPLDDETFLDAVARAVERDRLRREGAQSRGTTANGRARDPQVDPSAADPAYRGGDDRPSR